MTGLMERSMRQFVIIRAAREIKKEIEKAGLDNLKILAESGISIVGTYLQGCSPQEKAQHKRELNSLLRMGITAEEVLDEFTRQMPELSPIIRNKDSYRKNEIAKIIDFLK